MPKLEVDRLRKLYGNVAAVQEVSFAAEEGEFVVLLGPSGCGKTTTLRLIAGFIQPDDGQIRVDGTTIASRSSMLPPEKRQMPMVFQSYAVWPHMTVFENVAYGLTLRRCSRSETRDRVRQALGTVKLQGMENRYPGELSGGQQQRVALARAIVVNPRVLLLDEPLSNLDAALRQEMRFELKELQRQLGVTTVYVTHDQAEALALADKLVVINDGLVEQIGPPADVYGQPASRFVATFLGNTNLLPVRLAALEGVTSASVDHPELGRFEATLPSSSVDLAPPEVGSSLWVSVRPADIRLLVGSGGGTDGAAFEGRVGRAALVGDTWEYWIRCSDDLELRVRAHWRQVHRVGDRVGMEFSGVVCLLK